MGHSGSGEVNHLEKFASKWSWMVVSGNRIPQRRSGADAFLTPSIDQPTVIRMESVTVSPKFQVVIPQSIRERLGIRSGEKVHVMAFQNRIEMIPLRSMRSMRGFLKGMSTDFEREKGGRL